jgi:hypothetical protein
MDRRITKRSAPWLVLLAPRPGEQAHICEGLVPRGIKDRVILVAVALAYSHAFWLELCLDDGALAEVLEHAWRFFGGAPRSWLFETRVPSRPRDHLVLKEARRHGAIARPLVAEDRVCWGEQALRFVPERLLRRGLLRELGVANRALRGFVLEVLQRPHPQMPERRVCEVLEEERRHLQVAGRP